MIQKEKLLFYGTNRETSCRSYVKSGECRGDERKEREEQRKSRKRKKERESARRKMAPARINPQQIFGRRPPHDVKTLLAPNRPHPP